MNSISLSPINHYGPNFDFPDSVLSQLLDPSVNSRILAFQIEENESDCEDRTYMDDIVADEIEAIAASFSER